MSVLIDKMFIFLVILSTTKQYQ